MRTINMIHDYLLRGSIEWTIFFFVLVAVAVFTQLTKDSITKFIPYRIRYCIKAAPAFFLAVVSWYVDGPILVTLGFLFCALGDVLLDLPIEILPQGTQVGGVSFAVALICFSTAYLSHRVPGLPLLPLALTNTAIGIFVLRWVFPNPKLDGITRWGVLVYFCLLVISNIISSTTSVPIFLGSSLWLMSDLSIALDELVSPEAANSLDTLGLYDLGLYFLAIGLLSAAGPL